MDRYIEFESNEKSFHSIKRFFGKLDVILVLLLEIIVNKNHF